MNDADLIRDMYVSDTLFATCFTFKHQEGRLFVVGDHHKLIAETLDKVFAGEIKRLLITIAPRYSKTTMVVHTVISVGLAINPSSKFIHTSYSDSLALENSEKAKDIINSDWYQSLFPYVQVKKDSKSKKKWWTTAGGGVYATSSGGQITGFGAGNVEDEKELTETINELEQSKEFSGAIIIDDPLKPDDASSATMREKVNTRFETTIRSRVNSRNTPIIVIMQRLHRQDLVGYLQELEPGEWTTLSLPALYTDENGVECALYPFKHTVEELKKIQSANRFVFETQYMQNPQSISEKLWAFAFDRNKHVGKAEYKNDEYLYLSFDFNRNPMTCSAIQHYNDTIYGIESIKIDNATVRMICKYIDDKYKGAFYIVTGDASGKNMTTVSLLNNYDIIKNYFGLSKGQMQYSASNPRLQDSRYFVNSIFEQYNVCLDKDNCKHLIFDLENVMADDENKPIKDNRSKVEEQADFFDNFRYYLHTFYKDFLKMR